MSKVRNPVLTKKMGIEIKAPETAKCLEVSQKNDAMGGCIFFDQIFLGSVRLIPIHGWFDG